MKQYGLPKEFRLLKRADFLSRKERIRRINTKSFTILCAKNRETGPRIGIVASRKVGDAVRRNRIKRLVREFFRLNREKISRQEDIIVIARPKTCVQRYTDIEEELRKLL